jgi:serine/threonine-protein kinase HipA
MNKAAFAAPRCPGTLKEGYSTYCPATLRSLFNGKQVFHVLQESCSEKAWKAAQIPGEHFGGQQWFRMKQVKNQLFPDKGGMLLLKTVFPGGSSLRFHMEQSGNEHFCMQLASQVFHLETIDNALIFFPDGQPALICRYFSSADGFIDFNSLQQRDKSGKSISSYRQLGLITDSKCAAATIAKEHLFSQVIFTWMIADAGAKAKNFGLIKTTRSDYTMAPVFSARCTRLHELGPELALTGGLYEGDKNTPEFSENGCYTRNEFTTFGHRIGLLPHRIGKIIDGFVAGKENAEKLLEHAFLPNEAKAIIKFNITERLMRLK